MSNTLEAPEFKQVESTTPDYQSVIDQIRQKIDRARLDIHREGWRETLDVAKLIFAARNSRSDHT